MTILKRDYKVTNNTFAYISLATLNNLKFSPIPPTFTPSIVVATV